MSSFEELCDVAERRGQRVELGLGKVRYKTKFSDGSHGTWRRVERLTLRAPDGKVLTSVSLNGIAELETAAEQVL